MGAMEYFRGDGRKTYQLRFTDHKLNRRQLSTRRESKPDALSVGNKIELLVSYRVRGDRLPTELQEWLNAQPAEIRDKLVLWDIVAPRAVEEARPLYNSPRPDPLPPDWRDPDPSLVDLWEQELLNRENTEAHAIQAAQRVRVLLQLAPDDEDPIQLWTDLTGDGIMARVRELRRIGPPPTKYRPKRKELSPQTCQHYLENLQQFCEWVVKRARKKGFSIENPSAGLVAYTDAVIEQHKERPRRALTMEEQVQLISGTPALPDRYNMTGAERALLYHTIIRTGLRAHEANTLKVANLNFWGKKLTILAKNAKASRQDDLPLTDELSQQLKDHCAGKLPDALVFTWLSVFSYCEMLHEDLDALQIPFKDHMGRFADFHALRHTYGTELARVVMPATHMKLMRHKAIATSQKFYTHIEDQDKAAGIAKLPKLELPAKPAEGFAG